MSNDSLRDQLLGLGFKPAASAGAQTRAASPERGASRPDAPVAGATAQAAGRPQPARRARPGAADRARQRRRSRPRNRRPRRRAAHARARTSTSPRPTRSARSAKRTSASPAEQAKQEEARLRREARAKLAELVKDKALNVADADIARHFPYGGKIKRIYVTAEQLKALNAGELGVLQIGRPLPAGDAAVLAAGRSDLPAGDRAEGRPGCAGDRRSVRGSAVPGARRPGLVAPGKSRHTDYDYSGS